MSELEPFCKVISNPSEIIKNSETTITINGVPVHLVLVSMKRSFLLVVNNATPELVKRENGDPLENLSKEEMIRGFVNSNTSLKGMSLSIGELNTCIINSDNSLASATLASRLSKKLNQNRPVYVANNFLLPYNIVDTSGFTSKLYLKIFQFIRTSYSGLDTEGAEVDYNSGDNGNCGGRGEGIEGDM